MRPPWSCWTTPTRSRRPLELAGAAVAALTLSACSPGAPPGVDRGELDAAVSRAIGDPSTCVIIAEAGSGKRYYRYNSATACAKVFAACDRPGTRRLDALLAAVVKDRQPRQLSCNTLADASRGVGWAAGPVAGTNLVYAAMMEGDRAFPGRMMAERLEVAFRRAKVAKQP